MASELTIGDIYRLDRYNYELPPDLIAQFPAEPRDSSRLLVLDRHTGDIADKHFRDITAYLSPGDTLVINRSRVIPARLFAYKPSGAKVELLLLSRRGDAWEALAKPAKRVKAGSVLMFREAPEIEAEVLAELDLPGGRLIRFHDCPDQAGFIERVGKMPLPPYINRSADHRDQTSYQTVYARENGSAAAPTAGLHFTDELLANIRAQGIDIAEIILHVGLGTFRPVATEDIRQHKMHLEHYQVDQATADLLNATRIRGGSIIAVGTTVVRTLETVCREEGAFAAGSGETGCFIYPGYKFQAIDGMITNFHLPGSSLLMLVAAWAGLDNTMVAYRHAVQMGYRFFSYGDAMLIY